MRHLGIILILALAGCHASERAQRAERPDANTSLTMYERLSRTRGIHCYLGHCTVRGVVPLYVVDGTPVRFYGESYVLNHLSVYDVDRIRVLSIDETVRYSNHQGSVVEITTKH